MFPFIFITLVAWTIPVQTVLLLETHPFFESVENVHIDMADVLQTLENVWAHDLPPPFLYYCRKAVQIKKAHRFGRC